MFLLTLAKLFVPYCFNNQQYVPHYNFNHHFSVYLEEHCSSGSQENTHGQSLKLQLMSILVQVKCWPRLETVAIIPGMTTCQSRFFHVSVFVILAPYLKTKLQKSEWNNSGIRFKWSPNSRQCSQCSQVPDLAYAYIEISYRFSIIYKWMLDASSWHLTCGFRKFPW